MAVSPLIRCGGLATDPNPLISAAQGGMRVADDVIIERGTARPRLGLNAFAGDVSAQRPRSMYTWGQTSIVSSWDGASDYQVNNQTSTQITGDGEPLDTSLSWVQFAPSRDSLYWTSKSGPRKITEAAATASAAAGMHEATSGLPSVASSGTPVVLPTDSAAAWRWCFRKVDANGMILRSPPSPWQTMTNTSGSTVDMSWIIPLPLYVAENDQIELYRTVYVTPSTATPSDMMFLARTYLVTAADVIAGSVTLRDSTPESALGQELYTNATREGALKANARPPASVALATWSECMWFGYVRGPWTIAFDIVTVSGTTSTDGLTGLQRLQRAADATGGSPTLTNLASTTSIKVGQLCTDGGFPGATSGTVPIGARVLSKTATTVTLDANCTGNEVGGSFFFHDGVTLDGLTYWANNTESVSSTYPTFAVNVGNREVSTARSLAYVISRSSTSLYAFAIEDPYYANPRDAFERYTQATVVVRSRYLDDAQWAAAFIADTTSNLPAIAFRASTSGTPEVSRDEFPNGLAYSKPSEPEAVPELNFILVGDKDAPVLALSPLRAGLLVWKTDGLYRITGTPPDGWRVDLIEPSTRLIRGECVSMLDGKAFAWTARGVVAADEGGAQSVSDGAISRALEERAGVAMSSTGISCAWVQTVPLHNLVLVGTCDSQAARLQTDSIFCLCLNGGGWSRWTFSSLAASVSGRGELRVARAGAWDIRETTPAFATTADTTMDALHPSLTWTNADGSIEIEISEVNAGLWVPKAGDWVSASIDGTTHYRRVTVVVAPGGIYTVTITEAFPSGAQTDCTAYEGIISKLQWQAFHVGTPAVSLFARELHVMLDWSTYSGTIGGTTARLLLGASTNLVDTAATQEWTKTRAALPTLDARATVPVSVSRAAHFYPYVETCDIGLEWRCDGVVVVYDGTSEKGSR